MGLLVCIRQRVFSGRLRAYPDGFSDAHDSTSVYVPSIGLVVAGDVAYNGVHLYLAETTRETRKEWRTLARCGEARSRQRLMVNAKFLLLLISLFAKSQPLC